MKKSSLILIAIVVLAIILTLFLLTSQDNEQENSPNQNLQQQTEPTEEPISPETEPTEQAEPAQVKWEHRNGEWKPSGTPPACPEQIIKEIPVDMNLVIAALWPGQERGGDFKPHGGFRFDNSDNSIEVRAPIDSYLNRGSRYLQDGEPQILLEFIHPCGIMYRFDHLVELTPELEEIVEGFPEAVEGDSRSTEVEGFEVLAGDLIATSIGFEGNVFVDFGVYDLRDKNDASEDEEWLAEHGGDQAPYALCWFDLLPSEDGTKMRELPTGNEGKVSNYC